MSLIAWFLRLLGVFTGKKKRTRISRQHLRNDVRCEWCDRMTRTTLNEIWSAASPDGYLVRLCDSCLSTCASA